jgi:hypothetical protein
MSDKTIPGLFLNSKQATTAHRLMMSIVELRDMSNEYSPAPEMPTSVLEILAQEALGLFEEAKGFHFYDHDEMEERLQHLNTEAKKAREALDSLKMKTN